MKKYLLTILSVVLSLSCTEKIQPQRVTSVKDSAEDILIGVSGSYTVESVTETEISYQVFFCEYSPISLKKDYPEGIQSLVLSKSSVSDIRYNDGKTLYVLFRDGRSASVPFDSWMEASIEKDVVYFNEEPGPECVRFDIQDSKPEITEVSVKGADDLLSWKVVPDKDCKGIEVIFTPLTLQYFEKEIQIRISNGKKSKEFKLMMIRPNFRFDDGTTAKEFHFAEYERYFELELDRYDKNVSVSVPQEHSQWLKAKVTHVNINGSEKTVICFLMSDNGGDNERNSRVLIHKKDFGQVLSVNIHQIAAGMDGSLRKGLISFYRSLDGSSWVNSENWCSDKPIFQWYGITAESITSKRNFGEEGYAYFGTDDRWSISLGANNMRGEIPMEFWRCCKFFRNIRISSEYLPSSTVPDCLWNENLESLDLSMSFMNIPFTDAISGAKNIRRINLQSCSVNGAIPSALTELSQLEYLNLRECGITGQLPAAIGNLNNLKECILDHNMELSGELPEGFYHLEKLRFFDINSTKVGGKLRTTVKNMKALEEFNVAGCEFEGTIPEEFGTLENLIGYDFDGNYFTELPQFPRYYGYNDRTCKEWVGSAGFPLGIPYHQRLKSEGRPEGYIVKVDDVIILSEIPVDGSPLKRPGYYIDYDKCHELPMPVWANVKYGIYCWTRGYINSMKYPKYPCSDDLQYPADEYYYDGKNWRHPSLQYPAREYCCINSSWVHDPSCPWDQNYSDPGKYTDF